MARRPRTPGAGPANQSRRAPAKPSVGSFDIVVRILAGEFDGPELVALYQAAYLRMLEVSPALLADAQRAMRDAQDDIRRLIRPE
jgi:hypothetical protein